MLCYAAVEAQVAAGTPAAPRSVLRVCSRDATYRVYATVGACSSLHQGSRVCLSLQSRSAGGACGAASTSSRTASSDPGFERLEDVAQALAAPYVAYTVDLAAQWFERSFAVLMREHIFSMGGLLIAVLPYHMQPSAKLVVDDATECQSSTPLDPARRYDAPRSADDQWPYET